jgi:RecA/RadA recombinase
MGRPKKKTNKPKETIPTVEVKEEQHYLFPENKMNKAKAIMNEINRDHKEVVIKFAKDEQIKGKLPFGIPLIDKFAGGAIFGNFVIVYGSEGTGKSTLVLNQIATAQKQGKVCAYLDLENGFNIERAKIFGIDVDNLILINGINNAEDAMDIVIKLSKEKVVDYIAVDSIQAMSPKAEQESKAGKERLMDEDEIALLAKKMGKFLRRCNSYVYKAKVAVLLIGQVRTGGIGTFATHEELTGGKALKHWSLLTLFIRKGQKSDAPREKVEIEEEDEKGKKIKVDKVMGFDAVLKIEKTKTNSEPELSELHIPFYFASGFLKD